MEFDELESEDYSKINNKCSRYFFDETYRMNCKKISEKGTL